MALKEKITQTTHLTYFEGKIPISFRYTYGLAGELFFRQIKDGKLIGSVAQESGTVYCPPRIFCEDSFEEITDTMELPGTGVVETFTICCEDMHGQPQAPELLALVRLDEADGGLVAPLHCDLDDVFIGMPVKIGFVPKKERQGNPNDIFFVPCE